MNLEKIVIIKKATPFEELLRRHATTSQVSFYLESRGESYQYYLDAHNDYRQGVQQTIAGVPTNLRSQVVEKEHLPSFHFTDKDLVVVVGDPGLFVNAAKYVGEQPVVVVNPDPSRFDDVFTSCNPKTFPPLLQKTLDGKVDTEKMTMAEVRLNDGQTLLALNDFYVGRNNHVSARYEIQLSPQRERQSSSGIIISTGTGSTGWLTSVMMGAYRLADVKQPSKEVPFPRDAPYLLFAVREPFPSKTTGTNLIYGQITRDKPLQIHSHMPENGVIFSDGIESDYLTFNSGCRATIAPAEKKVYLVKA
ncbi:NAD(+)/NADH kinase [Candidatus Woesearchaeota archaeon]|nr:NAD(+)/NADH kinase [Candidatus Woesearchaeota archaeon]